MNKKGQAEDILGLIFFLAFFAVIVCGFMFVANKVGEQKFMLGDCASYEDDFRGVIGGEITHKFPRFILTDRYSLYDGENTYSVKSIKLVKRNCPKAIENNITIET